STTLICHFFVLSLLPRPPSSTLFPYTTLFRSHLLTMHSAAGRLYEVDVRLRPSGKGGLLVTNIEAFADYQRREAWTWEHQALLRSEEHTSELQSLRHLVCRLLLEKKKTKRKL